MTPREKLASELRAARLTAGFTSHDALAAAMAVDRSLVSKAESATQRVPSDDVLRAWAEHMGKSPERWLVMAEVCRSAADGVPGWFASWVDAEQHASLIRWWEPLLVPGLLQTTDYARAVFDAWQAIDGGIDTDELVDARLARQAIFDRPSPPSFWALIDETVLHRSVGDSKVMHDQLLRLADMSERPRVTIEVVPAEVGVHVDLLGAFAIAGFEDDTPGIVYLESPDQGETTKHPATVAKVALTYDTLRTEALGGRASHDLILKVAEERWT
jgi:transcriptional regulator with XRE-family HTH domain